MSEFPFTEYVTVSEFAEIHGVARVTVYRWINQGSIPYALCPYMGRKLRLIRKNTPRPVKKTTLPHWLHPNLKTVPSDQIIMVNPGEDDDLPPWFEKQVIMEDLL